MNQRGRQGWLALVGLAVGLGLGLLYAWLINPIQYTDTAPASLRADHKAEYVQLVARAFAVEGNLDRARARLAVLGETDLTQAVTALAQRTAASGGDPETVRSLAALAAALGARPAFPTPAQATATAPIPTLPPTPTVNPSATPSPRIIAVPSPTAAPPGAFDFVGKQAVCNPKIRQALMQVLTLDSSGEPVPGVEVLVEWDGGFDHFFTGLKPELGLGYGDFAMMEGVNYSVRLAASPSAAVTDLAVESCTDDAGRPFFGSWLLVFRQS